MKIALDAFNLGLHQGTGIATYTKELAKLLASAGHDIYPIYGLDVKSSTSKVSHNEFIQRLGINGEVQRKDLSRWAGKFLLGGGRHLLGLPFSVKKVVGVDQVELGSARDKIPAYHEIYNSPSIFRISQAFSFFTGKTTKLTLPNRPDIFHATCPLPLSVVGTPKVVTVHDIIPIVLPTSTEVNIRHYYKMVWASLKDASGIFCVSETSRTDLLNNFDIPENKIHVTYQSVELPERIRNIDREHVETFLKNLFHLKFGEYFIYYGAIEPKKNVVRIIEAFQKAKTDFPIVIVGKNGWLYDDVDRILASNNVNRKSSRRFIRIPYLSFQNLMILVKGARGLVFPSLYEGFGLPVLEAMQIGCPVITSNVSSLPEVGGDAVLYVDPYDVSSIISAVEKLSSDDTLAGELVNRGYIQAQRFSREAYLKRLDAGYEAAIR